MKRNYKYSASKGTVYSKIINVKKALFTIAASFGIAGAMAVPALAASNNYCGSSANGCSQSGAETGSCAGHGAFGAFGKDNSFAGGANGDHTAYYNSGLCGNPSPNSSAAKWDDHTN